ncbi:MAG: efflux RND transporter periplasmic adaptor subunit [Bryobacteraceae bacterium]
MKRLPLIVIIIIVAGAGIWLAARRSAPIDIPFVAVTRETVESALNTNGRIEPVEWAAVRAERTGTIDSVPIVKGQSVATGTVLATLRSEEAQAELTAAEARMEQARAQIATIGRGGSAAERAEIDRAVSRTRLDRDAAQKEVDILTRLVKQQASTSQELNAARQRVDQAAAEIQSLEAKRTALTSENDKQVAEAQLRDAQAAAAVARQNIAEGTIRAPIAGTVYALDIRRGAYLNPGDAVASIGQLDRLRVFIYVDEPELGRVAIGMPVKISWDAVPGRTWPGTVDRVPTQVAALGNRQVGEVIALIDNPGHTLIPGTNINAEIQSKIVPNALSIPKEAIRRRGGTVGVYLLEGDHLTWRPVTLGVSSITRSQVLEGLKEGDSVVGITERELTDGLKVR